MKKRISRIENTQTIQEAIENARLVSLAKLVTKKMKKISLHDYQAAVEKLSDDELSALCWANEQDAKGVAWSRIPTATLEAIASTPADEDASLDDVDQATETLRAQYPANRETPSQFQRRYALFHG